jgi:hypothetical protein
MALIARHLGGMSVYELEPTATALSVTVNQAMPGEMNREDELRKLKPHVDPLEARRAIALIDKLALEIG